MLLIPYKNNLHNYKIFITEGNVITTPVKVSLPQRHFCCQRRIQCYYSRTLGGTLEEKIFFWFDKNNDKRK